MLSPRRHRDEEIESCLAETAFIENMIHPME